MRTQLKLLWIALMFCTCSWSEEKIKFGEDHCVYCRMSISDPRYGALLVTDKGRIRKYDAAECMINDVNENAIASRKMMVIAYDQPKKLIHVDSAYFVISSVYNSPMGANMAAFSSKEAITDSLALLTWQQANQSILK
ncbi:nitrous oxide reductase accessory protein NosL [Ekhidna sp.]|uniref:nitrous oxide reductase accessory protein NosL n=1 Tax=Ekhidna sp. TaxID=2608089 RepID=UPI003B59801C